MRTESEARRAVIDEAMEWEGTPYIPSGRVKGRNGGCDCLTFVAGVYEGAGIIDRLPIPQYPHDFHLHSDAELYLLGKDDTPGMLHFCDEIDGPPQRADIVLFKFGLCFSHAAIVIEWPMIIHAWAERPVGPEDAMRWSTLRYITENYELRKLRTPRPRRYFTVKDWSRT